MTTRSRIIQVFTAEDVTSAANSTQVNAQRLGDELGAVQLEMNQSPGAGATGNIWIQGRMSPDASWVLVATAITIVSFHTSQSQIITDVDMLPQMRIRIDTPGTITGGTTLDAWLQE